MVDSTSTGNSMVLAAGFPGRVALAYTDSFELEPSTTVDEPSALDPSGRSNEVAVLGTIPAIPTSTEPSTAGGDPTPGHDFYETFHVIERSYALGNVLSTVQTPIVVLNAYRRTAWDWDTFVNGAGAGTSLLSMPALPSEVAPLEDVPMTLQVEVVGPAVVDDTLDFGFEDGATIVVPITLQRVVLFPVLPEASVVETLEFLTDVMGHKDGTEQRVALRLNPRQFFELEFLLSEGPEMTRLDNVLFEWQHRLFGLPVWHERTPLTVAATASDTTVTVQQTAYRDLRVDGIAVVYTDDTTYDVLEVDSFTATTVTFKSPLLNSYPVGAFLVPARTAHIVDAVGGGRARVNLGQRRAVFRVVDNEVGSIASTAAFSSYNSLVLFDDCNLVERDSLSETFERRITVIDEGTGVVMQDSAWDRNRRSSLKGFRAAGVQATWELRQLLHALRGRQVPFYLPTFWKDLEVNAPLVSSTSTMSIVNVGYNRYVQERQPKNVIRVVFKPSVGQSPLIREVLSSSEVDPNNETLTLDGSWPSTFAVADVERVEFVEKSRFDTDRIALRHRPGSQSDVRAYIPVKTVLE